MIFSGNLRLNTMKGICLIGCNNGKKCHPFGVEQRLFGADCGYNPATPSGLGIEENIDCKPNNNPEGVAGL